MFGLTNLSNDKIVIVILLVVLFGYLGYRYFYGKSGSSPQEEDGSGAGSARGSGGQKPQLVLYYANWCGYSKQFLPEWNKFVQFARTNLPQVDCKEVVCEGDNQKVCQDHKVPGFPTVRLYKASGAIDYDGNRTAQDLAEFVAKNWN